MGCRRPRAHSSLLLDDVEAPGIIFAPTTRRVVVRLHCSQPRRAFVRYGAPDRRSPRGSDERFDHRVDGYTMAPVPTG